MWKVICSDWQSFRRRMSHWEAISSIVLRVSKEHNRLKPSFILALFFWGFWRRHWLDTWIDSIPSSTNMTIFFLKERRNNFIKILQYLRALLSHPDVSFYCPRRARTLKKRSIDVLVVYDLLGNHHISLEFHLVKIWSDTLNTFSPPSWRQFELQILIFSCNLLENVFQHVLRIVVPLRISLSFTASTILSVTRRWWGRVFLRWAYDANSIMRSFWCSLGSIKRRRLKVENQICFKHLWEVSVSWNSAFSGWWKLGIIDRLIRSLSFFIQLPKSELNARHSN